MSIFERYLSVWVLLCIVAGIGLILFALLSAHPLHNWGWIGVPLLVTGLIGWCPAYLPFGIKTCKTR